MKKKIVSILTAATLIFLSAYITTFADSHFDTIFGINAPQNKNENFKTDLFTGSVTYSYPIALPKGTDDLTPSIDLSYSSQSTRNVFATAGSGWQMNRSYIERDANFTPGDISDDKFKLILNGSSYDLVNAGNSVFHTSPEYFLNITQVASGGQNTQGSYWQVITKDGTSYRFGYLTNSENLCDYGRVGRWHLDQVTDPHGNKIFYTYNTINEESYLTKIEYNTNKERVINLTYVQNANTRTVNYQACTLQENQELSNISITANSSAVASYKFAYTNQPNGEPLLTSITHFGSDGVTSLPPTKFDYKPQINPTTTNGWQQTAQIWLNNAPVDADLRQQNLKLIDVNGDGLPDIVKTDEFSTTDITWKVLLNTGSGWSSTWANWINHGNIDLANLNDSDTTLADVNGDGLPDIVRSRSDFWEAFMNTGSSWSTTPITLAQTSALGGVQLGAKNPNTTPQLPYNMMIDMNGDGKADLLATSTDNTGTAEYDVYLNTGSGFGGKQQWMRPLGVPDLTSRSVRVVDVNGDGLPDVVYSYSTDTWRVFTNIGNALNGGYQLWLNNANVNATLDWQVNARIALADANGDGLPDIVRSSNEGGPNNSWEVLMNLGNGWATTWVTWVPQNTTMTDVSNTNVRMADVNGDGIADIVSSDTNGGNDTWNVWVNNGYAPDLLNKVTTKDGGVISFEYTPSTKFSNTSLPFPIWVNSKLTKNNGLTNSQGTNDLTTYSYSQGLYDWQTHEFRGFGTVKETDPALNVSTYSFNQDVNLKGRLSQVTKSDANSNPFSQIVYAWYTTPGVLLQTQKNYTYDGVSANPKIGETDYTYDSYGNIVKQSDLGDTSTNIDDKFTYNEYTYNPTAWIVGARKHTYINAADDLTKTAESFFYYDNNPNLTDVPAKGDLTKAVRWVGGTTNLTSTYTYDGFGNKLTETDPNGGVTTYTYEITGTYPNTKKNALNQQMSLSYDLGTGNLLSQTDPNNLQTSYIYDFFGRELKEIKQLDSTSFPTTSYTYFVTGTAPSGVLVSKRQASGAAGTFDTYSFTDGLGRTIQTRNPAKDTTKQIVTDVFYNNLGLTDHTSVPHFDSLVSVYSNPLTGIGVETNTYDPIGRVLSTKHADNTVKSVTYDHFTQTNTDENGNKIKNYFDGNNKIIQVDEITPGGTYSTKYVYDALGDLTKITNTNGANIINTYDALGRKLTSSDPDLGNWSYQYDGNGNVIKQTDAKGVVINKTYDLLNRVKTIDYPTDTDSVYAYDTGKIGTLASVTDGAGTVTYTYDNRLRKLSESRVVDGLTFATNYTYDSLDRLLTQTNPDGTTTITNTYNPQGELNSVSNVLNNIDYNPLNKITKKDYANTLSTNYTYDPNSFRLTRIQTGTLQDLNYTYDNVGNILSINNAITSKVQNFGYDVLNRLTAATEANGGYNYAYTYDPTGNLTKFVNGSTTINYTYGTSNLIHALVSSDEASSNTIVANDTFVRANQSLWGTASDGQTWGGDANTASAFSISSNTGKLTGASNNYNAVLGPNLSDAEVLFKATSSTFPDGNMGALLRWTDTNNWYKGYIDGTNLFIAKKVAGAVTNFNVAYAATPNINYTIRFRAVGNVLSIKVWPTSSTEPTNWMLTVTDSTFTSGRVGLRLWTTNNSVLNVTSFTATNLAIATPTPTPSPMPTPTTSPSPTPGASYNGDYFNNQTLTGTPTLTRQDATINFDWGSGSPDASISVDHFSVRWTRNISFTAGNYTFSTTSDDGVRLKIDGTTVIDKWIDQGSTTWTYTGNLTAGNHLIVMEYYENGGGAVAKMSYVQNTATPTPTPVPPSPTPTPTATPSVLYGFEDGTVMGWGIQNNLTAISNSTDQAYAGTKSLKIHTNFAGGGWSSGLLSVTSNVLQASKTISAKVYLPASANGISTSIFFQDANWSWNESQQFALTPGQWNTVSWTPTGSFVTPVNKFGFQMGSGSANNLDVYFDNIDIR